MSETPQVGGRAIPLIRAERAQLLAQEVRVSYWRSIVGARLDEVTKGRARVTRPARQSPARGARVDAPTPADGTGHGDQAVLWRVWSEVVDRSDPAAVAAAVASLTTLERSLSADRAALHRRLDDVTAELIAAYRRDPLAAMDTLPDPR
jgi:hypothetical protein